MTRSRISILIGTVATPWFTWASQAAKTLF